MCILLKLHYANFDVSRLFCLKVIKEKPFGSWLDPPFGKGRVKKGNLSKVIKGLQEFRRKIGTVVTLSLPNKGAGSH